jgi:hypothetical protein
MEEKAALPLRKTSVLLMLVLSGITAGIFQPIWFLTRRKAVNSLNSKTKLGAGRFILVVATYIAGTLLSLLLPRVTTLGRPWLWYFGPLSVNVFTVALSYVAIVILGVNSFWVRRAIHDHMQRESVFSWIGTFLFQIFYLQYRINRL